MSRSTHAALSAWQRKRTPSAHEKQVLTYQATTDARVESCPQNSFGQSDRCSRLMNEAQDGGDERHWTKKSRPIGGRQKVVHSSRGGEPRTRNSGHHRSHTTGQDMREENHENHVSGIFLTRICATVIVSLTSLTCRGSNDLLKKPNLDTGVLAAVACMGFIVTKQACTWARTAICGNGLSIKGHE